MLKMGGLREVLRGAEVKEGDVTLLEDKLLFDRTPVRDRYVRYVTLMSLATVIAAYGVLSDSVAIIIGAMIVAPMMTPILAMALSSITGDHKNIIRSMLIVAGGTVLVVGLSYIFTSVMPGIVTIAGNNSVSARTSPGLVDLVIALAAGAAGAFATSREDVSDALPGVAIAVSLVPPLAVVGICLSAGDARSALGALLLFLTNFLAIVAAGLLVFAIMGYGGAAIAGKGRKARRRAVMSILAALVLLSVPLGLTSYRVTTAKMLEHKVDASAVEWLEGTGFEVFSTVADGARVEIRIAGAGEAPSIDLFLSALESRGAEVEVEVKVVPEQTLTGTTIP